MASAGKVGIDLSLAVKPRVGVGPSTLAGGTVTLTAYALALVAYFQGARDEATISALVVGTVSLVTTLVGRFAQATAAVRLAKPAPVPAPAPAATSMTSTFTTPATVGAYVRNDPPAADEDGDPDALPDYDTTDNPPPDQGDTQARPETTS